MPRTARLAAAALLAFAILTIGSAHAASATELPATHQVVADQPLTVGGWVSAPPMGAIRPPATPAAQPSAASPWVGFCARLVFGWSLVAIIAICYLRLQHRRPAVRRTFATIAA